MIDRAFVIARAAYLAAIPDGPEWDAALADAALNVDRETWGDKADYVTFLLAAHRLVLTHPGLEPKAVVSFAAGGVSKTNAVAVPAWAGNLSGTVWGREYELELQRLPNRILSLPGF